MRFFSRKKTPVQHGLELSRRLKKAIDTIPDALASGGDHELFNLKEFETKKIVTELIILTYAGQRLALQLIYRKGERDMTKRREICNALDQYASEFLDDSQEFFVLLDKRGEQYLHLIQSHNITMGRDNLEKFFKALHFEFVQFCRGGGGDENEPLIIGSFASWLPLGILASQYWIKGFTDTDEYIDEHGI